VTELEKDALTILMHRLVMPADQRKPELADAAEQRLRVPFKVLNAHLQAQSQMGLSYLSANRFTISDVCVASVLAWTTSSDLLMSEFPAVKAWLDTCIKRPTFASSRKLAGSGLFEGVSTRMLIHAAKLMSQQTGQQNLLEAALIDPVTDEPTIRASLLALLPLVMAAVHM
jgi:hypothetical protein